MKFLHVTAFFGPHSFGGDAVAVDRIAGALARRGHEVHVVYCRDSFELLRGEQPDRPYAPPPGVTVHRLESGWGPLAPLAAHQTGRPLLQEPGLRRVIDAVRPDVTHFHNISLFGPEVLRLGRGVRVMTAHEHWLVCPLSVLWKFDDRVCEAPDCVRCVMSARRPPQIWRGPLRPARAVAALDALISPTRALIDRHRERGLAARYVQIPHFLPGAWGDVGPLPAPRDPSDAEPNARPYFAAAGRWERIKGFHVVAEAMAELPEFEFRLAGGGPDEPRIRAAAAGRDNVRFLGWLAPAELRRLYAGAAAVVVPSLVYESFGYAVPEAFAAGAPVVVRNHGGQAELARLSGGGLAYDDRAGLVAALRRLATEPGLRDGLATSGRRYLAAEWNEDAHLARYLGLIADIRAGRRPPMQ
jgi:glycosyltransferase involved in cell wall biosynthesis